MKETCENNYHLWMKGPEEFSEKECSECHIKWSERQPTKFGVILRRIRKEKGLWVCDLAEACNMAESYISCMEYGKKRVSKNFMRNLKKFLSPLTREQIQELEEAAWETETNLSISLVDRTDVAIKIIKFFKSKIDDLTDEDFRVIGASITRQASKRLNSVTNKSRKS